MNGLTAWPGPGARFDHPRRGRLAIDRIEALAREAGDVTLLVNSTGIVRAGNLLEARSLGAARAELSSERGVYPRRSPSLSSWFAG